MKTSTHTVYKAVTWTVMITCIIGHVAGTLVLIFQCKPISQSWRPRPTGKCLPNDATFYGLAAVTILFDVVIFFLPIPLLLRLNISTKKKFALVCVFLLGLLTTVCSIMRMVQIITIARTGNSTMLVLWGVIELNIGVRIHPLSPFSMINHAKSLTWIQPYVLQPLIFSTDYPHLHPNPWSFVPILPRLLYRSHRLKIRHLQAQRSQWQYSHPSISRSQHIATALRRRQTWRADRRHRFQEHRCQWCGRGQ